MTKMISFVRTLCVTAIVSLLAQSVWAAITPTVSWNDGEIELGTKNGFTMSVADGDTRVTITDGKATVAKSDNSTSHGLKIEFPSTFTSTQATILIKYSGYDAQSLGNNCLLSTAWGRDDQEVVVLGTSNGGNIGVFPWVNSSTVGNNNRITASPAVNVPKEGILLVTMSGSGDWKGTKVAMASIFNGIATSFKEVVSGTDQKYDDGTFRRIKIGGSIGSSGGFHRPKMTIEAVKIYDSMLTADDINADILSGIADDYKPFYKDFSGRVLSWTTASDATVDIGDSSGKAKFNLFDLTSGSDTDVSYNGNGTAYTEMPGYTLSSGTQLWRAWCSAQTTNYKVPGFVLRIPTYVSGATLNIKGTFEPLCLGGLIVEENASNGSSIPNLVWDQDRTSSFGVNGYSTFFVLKDSLNNDRGKPTTFYGDLTLDIADGKMLKFQSGKMVIDAGCSLKLCGGGKIRTADVKNANGSKIVDASGRTLDFRGKTSANTFAYFDGQLTVSDATTIHFPATLAAGDAFALCTGTLSAPNTEVVKTVFVGESEKDVFLTYSTGSKSVSYKLVAAVYDGNSYDSVEAAIEAAGDDHLTDIVLKDGATISATSDYKIVDGTVVKKNYVAQVGDVKCETFAEAMALDGDITILGDIGSAITLTKNIVIVINDDIELATVFSGNFGVTKKGSGTLTMTGAQTFTGDFVVEAGKVSASAAVRKKENLNAYVEVMSGANLTLTTGVQVDSEYKFKLAGSGINGEGALVMATAGSWSSNKQITSIELTDDATVGLTMTSGGTGLIASGHGASSLILNGHTFTKKGAQPFFFCNTTVSDNSQAQTGKIVVEEGTIEVVNGNKTTTIQVPVEGKLDIQAPLVHTVNSGKSTEYEATVNAKLTKNGAGTLTLKNTSTLGQNAKFTMGGNNSGALKMTDAFSVAWAGAITVEANKTLPLDVSAWLKIVGGVKGSGTLNLTGGETLSLNSDDDGVVVDGTTINTSGNLSLRGLGNRTDDNGTTGDCILKNATINITGGKTSRRGVVKISGNTSITKTGGTVGDESGGKRFDFDTAELLDNATLKISGIDNFTVTTQVDGKKVIGDGSEATPYMLATKTYTVTLKTFDHTTCYAKIGTDGEEFTYNEPITVNHGGAVYFRYVADENYKIEGNANLQFTGIKQDIGTNLTYSVTVVLNVTTITIPTVENMTAAVVDAEGETIAMIGNTITVTIGSTFTVTYTPVAGYVGSSITLEPITASTDTVVTAPTEGLPVVAVAKIGTTLYPTFEAALAAAGEITLLQNVELANRVEIAGKEVVLNLNGKAITYGGAPISSGIIIVHNGAGLTVNGDGSISSGANAYAAIQVTMKGDDAASPAKLTVNGGTLTGTYYAIVGNGSRPNTEITINGGTFTATDAESNLAIFHPQTGTLTITGGTFTGHDSAIEMRAGTLTISGGTFTATATTYASQASGSGSTVSGAAIAVSQHTTKNPIDVSISGGTFNGLNAIAVANKQNATASEFDVEVALTGGTFNGALMLDGDVAGATVTKGADATITAPEGYTWSNGVLVKIVQPTTDGIQVVTPDGADKIVIESVDVEIAADATAIPFETGVYTITAKKGDTVVATETLGVIAAKDAEVGQTPDRVTTAVAVPFTGATVANLLNTALLKEGDTLTAQGKTWTLNANKTWIGTYSATTALARGTAVWVMTAGKIVVLGKYDDNTEIAAPTEKETYLLANPKMKTYTPSVKAGDAQDQIVTIGITEKPVRYTKKNGKWTTPKPTCIKIPGTDIEFTADAEENPEIPVGKGFWFIKK